MNSYGENYGETVWRIYRLVWVFSARRCIKTHHRQTRLICIDLTWNSFSWFRLTSFACSADLSPEVNVIKQIPLPWNCYVFFLEYSAPFRAPWHDKCSEMPKLNLSTKNESYAFNINVSRKYATPLFHNEQIYSSWLGKKNEIYINDNLGFEYSWKHCDRKKENHFSSCPQSFKCSFYRSIKMRLRIGKG